jgi:hypothetical protein
MARPAPAPQASPLSPRIVYRPMVAPRPARRSPTREMGLLVCGALLLFCGVLLAIAFAVHVHAYVTADAHWAANTALTPSAREAGVLAVRESSVVRAAVFGPLSIVFGASAIVALFRGGRRKR